MGGLATANQCLSRKVGATFLSRESGAECDTTKALSLKSSVSAKGCSPMHNYHVKPSESGPSARGLRGEPRLATALASKGGCSPCSPCSRQSARRGLLSVGRKGVPPDIQRACGASNHKGEGIVSSQARVRRRIRELEVV